MLACTSSLCVMGLLSGGRSISPRMAYGPGGAPEGERIVVTGVGVVSALGSGADFWERLLGGESGIRPIVGFDASKFPTTIGAECVDFDFKP
eukprot:scaffold141745_cov17-Tisochrysis_lutea.AAC.1